MANATVTLLPSDVITTTSDELGASLAAVRAKALDASGDDRAELFDLFDQLLAQQRRLIFRDLKAIDRDPAIRDAIQTLSMLTQQIAKAKREMTTATQAIDRATTVLGFIDQVLGILGRVGVLA
jgi:hypothetical protein